MHAEVSQDIRIACGAQATQGSTILWTVTQNDRPSQRTRQVQTDHRHSFTTDNVLVIRNIQRHDSGLYSCHANNSSSPALFSTKLHVQGRQSGGPVDFQAKHCIGFIVFVT